MQPKQFIRLYPDQDTTLFGATLSRLPASDGVTAPILLCNNDHRFLASDECERHGIKPSAIVLEPVARNTAPAIAVAALLASRQDENAVIAVMPSDHVVADLEGFARGIGHAADVAATRKLVLLGIKPEQPHTGYGYIRRGDRLQGPVDTYEVAAFVEKPDRATAEGYLTSGDYLWNSGIFVLHAAAFLSELATYQPKVLAAARAALDSAATDLNFLRLDAEAFKASPSISVDYAVMERTSAAVVVPISVGWSDLGSWSSLWETSQRDQDGNSANGDVILHDTADCYIHATQSLVSNTRRPELVDHANRTELLVLQVMSARSGDTFLYRIVREANVRRRGFFEATPARNPQHLIDEFIQQCGADAARSLLNDMRQRYMEATNDLLDMIKVPVVLLWFSRRTPAYQPSYGSQYGLLSSFPHAVDEEMVMAISKRTTAYCECVSKSGDPHQLVNRFTGELEYQGQGAARTCINGYYPTPAMHQDAFDALSSTIKKMKLLA